jgi:uncharacterized protein (TIGR02996 family)
MSKSKASKAGAATGKLGAAEAAIAENPTDGERYLAYASLLPKGDSRAELIRVQVAIAEEQGRTGRAVDDSLFKRQRELMGAMALPEPPTNVSWSFDSALGHVKQLELEIHDWEDGPQTEFAPYFARLMTTPFMRFVQSLLIKVRATESSDSQAVVDALAQMPQPSALRSLDVRIQDADERSVTALELGALWSHFPRLSMLRVCAGSLSLGDVALPALESIDLEGALAKADVQSVAGRSLPKLNTLSLHVGDTPAAELATILDGKHFPELVDLGLRRARDADALCAMLAASPLASRLRFLTLSDGAMTETGARALAKNKSTWKLLEILTVERNRMPPRAEKLLKPICQRLFFDEQIED